MFRVHVSVLALLTTALLSPATAAAQESNFVAESSANPKAPAGWSLTPSISYGASWDDNVLIQGKGDATVGDLMNVVNPRATLDLNGRRGQLSATYDGAFVLYRDLNGLNSYDQHASVYGRRLVSPHVALFLRNNAASVPTTELSQFIAVPFVRTGSRLDDMQSGFEASFSKRTSMVASYNFQWVQFEPTQPGFDDLRGGHSNGATVSVKHVISPAVTLTADYDIQHAVIGNVGQAFDVQNWWAGAIYKLSEYTEVFGAGGVSRLGVTLAADVKVGPAWRLGLTRHFREAAVDVLYSQSFVPSYGFGGTTQNQEATGRFRIPLSRRVYATSSLSLRNNEPLTQLDLPLRSYWVEGTLGYAATPWVHVELFYAGTRQTIDRPGGTLDRNRIGVQVTTAKPVRVR